MGKIIGLEQRVQERWKTFEDKWSEKVVHPDDKEAVICSAEFRIRRAVQQDEDERWRKRIANEDKITTNAIETMRSNFKKMSAKVADEVVSLKNRHQGGAVTLRPGWCNTLSWPPESNSKDGAVGETFVVPASQWRRPNN